MCSDLLPAPLAQYQPTDSAPSDLPTPCLLHTLHRIADLERSSEQLEPDSAPILPVPRGPVPHIQHPVLSLDQAGC